MRQQPVARAAPSNRIQRVEDAVDDQRPDRPDVLTARQCAHEQPVSCVGIDVV